MKILKFNSKTLLILFLASFAFASCSKDDSVAPTPEPENQAPNSFGLIEVPDGATDIELQPQLTWEAATDPDGDAVTYQVYLDTQNPPQNSIANNLGMNTFNVEDELQPETTYYWSVIAEDVNGNTTESNIASFTSRNQTTSEALVGKWFFESIEGQPPFTTCEKKSFLQFTEDLFIQVVSYAEDSNGDCISSTGAGTYEVIGDDQIKITANSSTQTWVIQSLTDTALVIDLNGSILHLTKE